MDVLVEMRGKNRRNLVYLVESLLTIVQIVQTLAPMKIALSLAERGLVPEPVLRAAIRRLLRRRLLAESERPRSIDEWVATMARSEVALHCGAANAQHYEVPPAFFERVLGRRLKYSSALWNDGVASLDDAETAMIETTIERADLSDGQRVLELGCGWGSLTLAIAARFPRSHVVGVSNSSRQREFILARARKNGLSNVEVVTADMNQFAPDGRFDRAVSIEMFEHMRNWSELLRRIDRWLAPGGALFVHVFAHARFAYPFESEHDDDWMARSFFTGGMMPSADLLRRVAAPFGVAAQWRVDGTHYARTAEAWHARLLASRAEIVELFASEFGSSEATRVFNRWRMFFLACAELFAFRDGEEWFVSHSLLRRPEESS